MNTLEFLYIDPGTGGMLFTVLFGIFGVIVFSARALLLKMKFAVGRDKNAKVSSQKIPLAIFAETKRYWSIFEPILDELEKKKIIGPFEGSKPRKILITETEWLEMQARNLDD